MILYDLSFIEKQLRQRWEYAYKWGQKQNDVWDEYTHFIYTTQTWDTLVLQMGAAAFKHKLNKLQLFNYATNRWYNFWSAMAVEQMFCNHEGIIPAENTKDKEKDFILYGIDFDHKTSVLPAHYKDDIEKAKNNKRDLITWFYENQSMEKRNHIQNRLFIVVYAKNGEHWRLKADFKLLKDAINKYVKVFKKEKLETFTFNDKDVLCDILWVEK